MPYIFPSSASSSQEKGFEREEEGESDGEEDLSDSSIDDKSNHLSSSPLSSKKSRALSSSCIPLSIAVTDFHFLVLCRVRLAGSESVGRVPGRIETVEGDRNKKAERGKIAEAKRQEQVGSNMGYYLLAMSRLDGSLTESIDLSTRAPSSAVRIRPHHPHTAHHQGPGHGGIDPKMKGVLADSASNSKSALPAAPTQLREESMRVEGVPLGIFSDPETKRACLYTDKALYQVLLTSYSYSPYPLLRLFTTC